MTLARMRRRTRAWGRRQFYSFFSSLGTLVGHRLGTVMTVLVLGIAMLLPTGLFVAVNNLRALDFQQEDWGTLTVFLEPGLEQPQAHAVADRIGRERAAEVVAVSPEQGMQEFRDASGELIRTIRIPLEEVVAAGTTKTWGGDLPFNADKEEDVKMANIPLEELNTTWIPEMYTFSDGMILRMPPAPAPVATPEAAPAAGIPTPQAAPADPAQ